MLPPGLAMLYRLYPIVALVVAITVIFLSCNYFLHLQFCFKFFYCFILSYFCFTLSMCFVILHFVYYEQSVLLTVIVIPS